MLIIHETSAIIKGRTEKHSDGKFCIDADHDDNIDGDDLDVVVGWL